MSDESIWKRRLALDRMEREERQEATKDIVAKYGVLRRQLRAECELKGHEFRFTHVGIFDHIQWHNCTQCGESKCVNLEDASSPT